MNPELFPNIQTNNCMPLPTVNKEDCMSVSNVKFNQSVSLRNDRCRYDASDMMSIYPGKYKVESFRCCNDETWNHAMEQLYDNPTMSFTNGYGVLGNCGEGIDNDSCVRLGNKITNVRCRKQLAPRLTLTQPFMGRGLGDVCIENELQGGEDTTQRKQCNALASVHIDTFIPMIPCLQQNVQNPVHIIPEDNRRDWVWGGVPSRQAMRARR